MKKNVIIGVVLILSGATISGFSFLPNRASPLPGYQGSVIAVRPQVAVAEKGKEPVSGEARSAPSTVAQEKFTRSILALDTFDAQEPNFLRAQLTAENTTYSIEFVAGESLYDAMARLRTAGQFAFTEKDFPGLGFMVTSINGKEPEPGYSWIYYINGKIADLGVSSYKLKEGDSITWKHEKNY